MSSAKKSSAKGYDRLKQHEGKGYSGMPVGRSHKWYYDRGEWRERKLTPDEWEIYYETTKRRAAKAPTGTGAPVGTQYNWLIVSHQRVDKLDANSYSTCMEGRKFKVAHKRAGKDKWSAAETTQRRHLIAYLEQVIADLKRAESDAELAEELPYTTGEENRIYGLGLRTKAELYAMAREYKIPSRSKLSREQLLAEVRQRTKQTNSMEAEAESRTTELAGASGPSSARLGDKTRSDLYRIAVDRRIRGRSEMNKAELQAAVENTLQGDTSATQRKARETRRQHV